ncbi:MAG: N(4)-(beta-N-acetylglucosaminyl)-L-asparaginase [Planctomycetota bacterium]
MTRRLHVTGFPPDRRRFLKGAGGSLLAAFVPLAVPRPGAASAGTHAESVEAEVAPEPQGDGPRATRGRLVVSTWNFGRAANGAAWEVLARGGAHPLDACEAGVRVVEADPEVTSVGYGGLPNAAGVVELDANVIRGDTLACGAVAGMRGVKHPVSVARLVMETTPHVLLTGLGAREFATRHGFPDEDLLTERSRAAWEKWTAGRAGAAEPWERAGAKQTQGEPREDHDTIGMIALDGGRLATAVTTSGLAWKLPGRVGDSPIVGAGSACDDTVGAVVSTGVGEEVIRFGASTAILEGMRRGLSARRATRDVLARMKALHDRQGVTPGVAFLVVSRGGEVYGGQIHSGFEYAYTDEDGTRLIEGERLA